MKLTRRQGLKLAGCAALAAVPLSAYAESHGDVPVIEMLNRDSESKERQVFGPPVLMIDAGSAVMFKSTDRGHNTQSDDDMIPEGAEGWKSKIGRDFEVTLDLPGVYGYYCTPHRAMGMVGLILVGDVTQEQLEAARQVKQRGKAAERCEIYFALAEDMIAAN